jgi:hypothetical protein
MLATSDIAQKPLRYSVVCHNKSTDKMYAIAVFLVLGLFMHYVIDKSTDMQGLQAIIAIVNVVYVVYCSCEM